MKWSTLLVLAGGAVLVMACRGPAPDARSKPAAPTEHTRSAPATTAAVQAVEPVKAAGDPAVAAPDSGTPQPPASPAPASVSPAPPSSPQPAQSVSAEPPPAPNPQPPPPSDDEWPGVDTDLAQAPTLYLARVKGEGLGIWRKPKWDSGSFWTLSPGSIVEVVAEKAPEMEIDRVKHPAAVIRYGGLRGWTLADGLERIDAAPADGAALWKQLAERVSAQASPAAARIPADCPVALILADLTPGGTEELVVHSPAQMECRKFLGVADLSSGNAAIVDTLTVQDFAEIQVRSWGRGNAVFLDVVAYFMNDQSFTGERRTLYALSMGKLKEMFATEANYIDSRGDPVKYRMCRFAFPDLDGTGRWLIQQRTTLRSISGGKESDEVKEELFRFDGNSFAPAPRPDGLPELPAEPPSIVHG